MKSFATFAVLCVSTYFFVAGIVGCKTPRARPVAKGDAKKNPVEHGEFTFPNEEILQRFIDERNAERLANRLFMGWVFETPEYVFPLMLALAGGCLGGGARALRRLVSKETEEVLSWRFVFTFPIFSAVVGLMLFFLCYLLPSLFNFNPLEAYFIGGLSLLGGFVAEHAATWIEQTAKAKMFTVKDPEKKP